MGGQERLGAGAEALDLVLIEHATYPDEAVIAVRRHQFIRHQAVGFDISCSGLPGDQPCHRASTKASSVIEREPGRHRCGAAAAADCLLGGPPEAAGPARTGTRPA